jgi:hypothetical protein
MSGVVEHKGPETESSSIPAAAAARSAPPAVLPQTLPQLVQSLHQELKKIGAPPTHSSSSAQFIRVTAEAFLAASLSYRESIAQGSEDALQQAVQKAKQAAESKLVKVDSGLKSGILAGVKAVITRAYAKTLKMKSSDDVVDASVEETAVAAMDLYTTGITSLPGADAAGIAESGANQAATDLANGKPLAFILDAALVRKSDDGSVLSQEADSACRAVVAQHLISENFEPNGLLKPGKNLGEVLAQVHSEFPPSLFIVGPAAIDGPAGVGAGAGAGAGTGTGAASVPKDPNSGIHEAVVNIQACAAPASASSQEKIPALLTLIAEWRDLSHDLQLAGVLSSPPLQSQSVLTPAEPAALSLAEGKSLNDLFLALEGCRSSLKFDASRESVEEPGAGAGAGAGASTGLREPESAAAAKALLKLMDEHQQKLNQIYQDSIAAVAKFEMTRKTRAEIWAEISTLKDLPADWTSEHNSTNIVMLKKANSPSIHIHLNDDCTLSFTATAAPDVIGADGKKETAKITAEFFKDYFDVTFKALKAAGGAHELVGGVDALIKGLARQYSCDESEVKKGLQEAIKGSEGCLDCLAAKTKKEFEKAGTPPANAMGSMSPADLAAARAQMAQAQAPHRAGPSA